MADRRHARLTILRPKVATVFTGAARPLPKEADAELLTPEHRRWREAVCSRAGWRCEQIEKGQRCERSRANGDRMIADHIRERADGGALYDPDNGQCLCPAHNTAKGLRARADRMQRPVRI